MRADAARNRARILEAAEAVFAEKGPSASTEEVAARAGVAIGTVFRHFPTKKDLLAAIVGDLVRRLTADVERLIADGDPATALFDFFTRLVALSAAQKTVVELLAGAGLDLPVAKLVRALWQAIETLLAGAQRAGTVRAEVRTDEVIALLTGLCQGALSAGWDADLQQRTLAVVFAGLRPPVARGRGASARRRLD
jgi:AcrR family transcriptional regulator